MRNLHCPLRKHLAELIVKSISGPLDVPSAYDQIGEPPSPEMGDLTFPCFILSKTLKKSPALVASELSHQLVGAQGIEKVDSAGPYVNVTFKSSWIGQQILEPIVQGDFFHQKIFNHSPRTMIEYSQPNTHKELHVGHMRNAALGDSLVRTLRYSGVEVVSTTFPGDMGTHVAKCLWYLKYHNKNPIPQENRGEWLGKIYSLAHLKLEDEEGSSQGEVNKKQLTEILKSLEKNEGEYFDLWKETRSWSIDLMKKLYEWADVHFDQWYWESEVDAPSIHFVKTLLHQGKLVESQGAVGMDLSADNLGFCMLLKSDGTGLYATKDLELARKKFQDFNIDKSVYVVDQRQALHFKQVFKVLEKIGYPQAQACYHLQYNFVELPDGAMSSRKGNIVPIMQLVEKMKNHVRDKYLVRYVDSWSKEEIEQVASQVAQGAIKYGMIKIDQNKKIVFDMEEWLKIDGDSGPFIQYSAARINSLCEKLGYHRQTVDWSLLTHPSERLLLKSLIHFHSVVQAAAETYRSSVICTYLFETAKRFNLFYHECSIGQADHQALKEVRLSLSYCTGQVLKKGLSLLGIPSPQRM